MNLDRLHELIAETTAEFRKGAAVTTDVQTHPGVEVVEIMAMPHQDHVPAGAETRESAPLTPTVPKTPPWAMKCFSPPGFRIHGGPECGSE